MKRCTVCGETKPLENFPHDYRKAGRRAPRCKTCRSAYDREAYQRWSKADPERARAKATASSRRLRMRNPDYHRAYYRDNIEKERARSRESMRQWREAHPESERDRKRRYREANIDAVRKRERENTHRRRALLGSTSPALAELMAELVTQPCTYCGTLDNITIDHIIPLSRGGNHNAENLTAACYSCNSSKGAKLLDEWDHGEPVVP